MWRDIFLGSTIRSDPLWIRTMCSGTWWTGENIVCSSSFSVQKQEPKKQKTPAENVATPASTEEPVFLQNKTPGAIVGYWLRGENVLFRHLNASVLITLRARRAGIIETKPSKLSPIIPRTSPTRKTNIWSAEINHWK